MSLKQGDNNIQKVYLGDTEIAKVMLGDSEVWSSGLTPGLYETEWVGAANIDIISGAYDDTTKALGLVDGSVMIATGSTSGNVETRFDGYDFASLVPAEAALKGIQLQSYEHSTDSQYVSIYAHYYLGETKVYDRIYYISRPNNIVVDEGSATTPYDLTTEIVRDPEFNVRHQVLENAGYDAWDSRSDGIQLKIHYEIL